MACFTERHSALSKRSIFTLGFVMFSSESECWCFVLDLFNSSPTQHRLLHSPAGGGAAAAGSSEGHGLMVVKVVLNG